ncbi:outer membrane autotransporter barrel domain [Sutterella sp. CAG:351]|uniref:autotransporter outer membrane beta-barrel domain-containing protein n=1 Tax=Dakarella massiliensis TaxID=1506471 RepID=UPI00033A956F|nr:outer membrane autotransporter barrel domain [Sutterella sp. CAG:351]
MSSGDYTGEDSYHAKGFTGSLEAGYTFGLKDWVSASGVQNAARLQLQGQVIRMGVRADSFVDNQGTLVEGLGYGNVRTRLGATLYHLFTNDRTGTAVKPYLSVNWLHDTKAFGTAFDTTENHIQGSRNVGEVKLGVEGRITKNLNLWVYTGYQGGDHGYRNVEALVGVKALF